MRKIIEEKLDELERAHGIRILYACESGSRAWGFASPDSDYDVRFIYNYPAEHYLSVATQKDVIGLPVNEVLDIDGWELRKALRLFGKSNAVVYEWLQSPIVYRERSSFGASLRALMPRFFSPRASAHHYLSMARNVFDELQGPQVRIKKYFYALRPLLATLWIVDRESVPPMEFGLLRQQVQDRAWQEAIDELLQRKTAADEKTLIEPVPLLQQWIASSLTECKLRADAHEARYVDLRDLDPSFRTFIQTA